jgi:hypothetical protein
MSVFYGLNIKGENIKTNISFFFNNYDIESI